MALYAERSVPFEMEKLVKRRPVGVVASQAVYGGLQSRVFGLLHWVGDVNHLGVARLAQGDGRFLEKQHFIGSVGVMTQDALALLHRLVVGGLSGASDLDRFKGVGMARTAQFL
jgi:hypothetical protein